MTTSYQKSHFVPISSHYCHVDDNNELLNMHALYSGHVHMKTIDLYIL